MPDTVTLRPYEDGDEAFLLEAIPAFWRTHHANVTAEEARKDLDAWTGEGHTLYLILSHGEPAGFLHMGSRGSEFDWLEDICVL